MLENSEQVRLSHAADGSFASDAKESASTKICLDRCNKCCGYIIALLVIQSLVAVALAFTVFKLKPPIIRVERLTLDNLELTTSSNVTLSADVWVKNPSFTSFKYGNMTTTLFYRGLVIGESRAPPGRAKAQRTVRLNITVDVMADRVLSRPGLEAGLVTLSSYTQVGGRMNLFIIGKQMKIKMNCNISINITTKAIQQYKCKRKIKL